MDNDEPHEIKKCYMIIRSTSIACPESCCRHFLNSEQDLNCAIIAARTGAKTLQEIGDYYGISRMRICQIEKSILGKLRKDSRPLAKFDPSSG